jgi:hypothetical protein
MTNSTGISPLRQRMIDDMVARGLGPQTQKGHIRAGKRFAAYLKRSPVLATADDVRGTCIIADLNRKCEADVKYSAFCCLHGSCARRREGRRLNDGAEQLADTGSGDHR